MGRTTRLGDHRRPAPDTATGGRRWWWCFNAAAAAGVVCGIAQWGWLACILGAVTVAVFAASIGTSLRAVRGKPAVPRIADLSLVASLAIPSFAALIDVLDGVGFLVVLILAGSSPVVTRRLASRSGPVRDSGAGQRAVQVPDDLPDLGPSPRAVPLRDLESLDDDALCLAWRRSYLVLQSARSAHDRLAVVAQRQRYLDELERRAPQALETWLASGARAAGNPLPFLRGHGRPGG